MMFIKVITLWVQNTFKIKPPKRMKIKQMSNMTAKICRDCGGIKNDLENEKNIQKLKKTSNNYKN